jgi:signal transduction histidine kinase
METNVNNLRSYILTRVKPKEKSKKVNIYDLLIGVIQNITEYASNRGIELKLNASDIRNLYVEVYEIDLVRALLNILHNAVKYSWVRKGSSKAYVQIDGKADTEWIYLSVENWGVAITEKEIEQGLIFNVGYRGTISSDRRRPGTGLGLYDAKKVIEKHKGQLTISSSPSLGNPANDYSKPFVTTVYIKLPRNNNQ